MLSAVVIPDSIVASIPIARSATSISPVTFRTLLSFIISPTPTSCSRLEWELSTSSSRVVSYLIMLLCYLLE